MSETFALYVSLEEANSQTGFTLEVWIFSVSWQSWVSCFIRLIFIIVLEIFKVFLWKLVSPSPRYSWWYYSSHTLVHIVWRLCIWCKAWKAKPSATHLGKVPCDSVVHKLASNGDRRYHSRPEATGRVSLICMHTQLSLVRILHLLTQSVHFSFGITYTICRMVMQEKIHGNSTCRACRFYLRRKLSLPFFSFNFLKATVLQIYLIETWKHSAIQFFEQ